MQETSFVMLLEPMVLRLPPDELLLSYNQIVLREWAGTISMSSGNAATTSANEQRLATVMSNKPIAQLLSLLQLEVESRKRATAQRQEDFKG